MSRRLLSHLLVTLAIFSLLATFFIWVLDASLLNPTNLNKALKDGGVPSAIASILPDKAFGSDTSGNSGKQNDQQNQQQNQLQSEQQKKDDADMKAKIAAVVTPEYVNAKLSAITTSVITFMKDGKPQPVLDISDFPTKLKASGVAAGDDINKNFSKPIELNQNGTLTVLPKYYKLFKLAKYLGALLFVLLLTAEYFVADKGNKMHLFGRIFLHAALWSTLWWVVIVAVPAHALPALKDKVGADKSIGTLIDAVVQSIQHLFSVYFLSFAIICWVLAIALYLARHVRKQVEKIQAVSEGKGKPKVVPNKR